MGFLRWANGFFRSAKGYLGFAKGYLGSAKGFFRSAKGVLPSAKGFQPPARGFFPIAIGVFLLAPAVEADFDRATGKWVGDVAPASFSELCSEPIPEEQRSAFIAELDAADQALAGADREAADSALGRAYSAVYRGGGESEISIKCLGESDFRRWFEIQLALDREKVENQGRAGRYVRERVRLLGLDEGAKGIVAFVEKSEPRSFVSAIGSLTQIIERLDADEQFGAFVLPEEKRIRTACRSALDSLRKHAAEAHRKALAAEAVAFDRPMTEGESSASDSIESAQGLAEALVGSDIAPLADKELIVAKNRARDSLEQLRAARLWNLANYADERERPSSLRALERGDEMLSRANRTGSSLELREAQYSAARAYYEFGGFEEQASSASAARASLEPALEARRAERKEKLERASEKLQRDAESARRSVERMKKSASEKKAFEDEAEAMEDELGF